MMHLIFLECKFVILLYACHEAVVMDHDRFWWNVRPRKREKRKRKREREGHLCVLGPEVFEIVLVARAGRTCYVRNFKTLATITDCSNFIGQIPISVLLRWTHTTHNSLWWMRARAWIPNPRSWLKIRTIWWRDRVSFFSSLDAQSRLKRSTNSSRFTKKKLSKM